MTQKQIRIQKPKVRRARAGTTEQAFEDAAPRIPRDKANALKRELESEGSAIDQALRERYS